MPTPPNDDDDELITDVLRRRDQGLPPGPSFGELCERWRRSACFVVRRIQASYHRGAPDDELEVYQEAVRKLMEKGLEQFKGVDENEPGRRASLKVFFLRIVKHLAIDRYRAKHEELAPAPIGDDAPEATLGEVAQAVSLAKRSEERDEAAETYWVAFRKLEAEHPNEAAIWRLYHHEGTEDHAECAARLSITVVNSYKRLSRAQAFLKLYLLDHVEGAGLRGAHHE